MGTTMKRLVMTAAVVAILASPVASQQHPQLERGFSPEKVFEVGDVDHVNLYQGNLAITIPIGASYPVGGGFSYQLNLTYNAKLWDWRIRTIDPDGNGSQAYWYPEPSEDSNAGLGWQLTLGRLELPTNGSLVHTKYFPPDGGEHRFYATLHEGDPADTSAYTRDGSYLRLVAVGAAREVEFPDGTVHRFDATGQIEWMEDRHGNRLTVTIPSPPPPPPLPPPSNPTAAEWVWTLGDPHRSHTLAFKWHEMDGEWALLLHQVRLEVGPGSTKTYSFHHTEKSVDRPKPFDVGFIPTTHPSRPAESATVQLLTTIQLPDGSAYRFDPNTGYAVDQTDTGSHGHTGVPLAMEVPTRGTIEWDWGTYELPVDIPTTVEVDGIPTSIVGEPPTSHSPGVVARRMKRGSTVLGQWTYAQSRVSQTTISPGVRRWKLQTAVTNPLGHTTRHYFTAYQTDDGSARREAERWRTGLPFSSEDTITGSNSETLYLSREIVDPGSSPTLVRRFYVRYERDKLYGSTSVDRTDNPWDLNRRVAQDRVKYEDSQNYRDVRRWRFDGMGNYRVMRTQSDITGGATRTETTEYNPARGTYNIDADTDAAQGDHTFTMPSTSVPWVLGTYTFTRQVEGTDRLFRTYCFDASTGFLEARRDFQDKSSGEAPSNADVVVWFEASPNGEVEAETYYGANDSGGLPSNICTRPGGAFGYRLAHTYRSGVLETSQYETALGTSIGWKAVDATVNATTGLVSSSRDTTGLQTDYTYDELGRVTCVKPAVGAKTQYQYTAAASSTSPAKATVTTRAFGGSGCAAGAVLGQQEMEFDGFGRVSKQKDKMPDDTFAVVDTTYDGVGNVASVSTPYADNATAGGHTTHTGYDAFGRARTITQADGEVITLTYSGDRLVTRTVRIVTGGTATSPAFTTATTSESYDRNGRLYQVVEPGGATGTYTYDVAGNLTNALLSGAGATQTRLFTYDGRGFLVSECHPELNPADPCIRYNELDARGHAHVADHPPQNLDAGDLSYLYDKAERMQQVSRRQDNQPLKKWVFANSTGMCLNGTDRCLGKVKEAWRYNVLDTPWAPSVEQVVSVEETYVYAGLGGRVSNRTTEVQPLGTAFVQSWAYDQQGNATTITYPRCTHTGCNGSDGSSATSVVRAFTNGRLTSVSGYASAITYHPSGMVNQVTHTNGTKLVIDQHANGMRRPHEIKVELPGGGTPPTLGVHLYDGAGNIYTRDGTATETYHYDQASRLVRYTAGTGACQKYGYDRYGNLTSLQRGSAPSCGAVTTQTFVTNAATNRLSAGVYDAKGNLESWAGDAYRWDPLNVMRHRNFPAESYIYTADDERVATLRYSGGSTFASETWTLRGLDNKVLRRWAHNRTNPGTVIFADGFESGDTSAWNKVVGGAAAVTVPGGLDRGFDGSQGQWIWTKDQVYRGGAMLAAVEPGGEVTHFAVDHLGTPRLLTDSGGSYQDVANYWGYGDNLGDDEPVDEEQKFTGHERDDHGNDNAADDLDYMHARYYGTHLCRFLSVDPARSADPKVPQSWNRYAYARGNPLLYVDPNGEDGAIAVMIDEGNQRLLDDSGADVFWRDPTLQKAAVVGVIALAGATALPILVEAGPAVFGALMSPEVAMGATSVAAGLAEQQLVGGVIRAGRAATLLPELSQTTVQSVRNLASQRGLSLSVHSVGRLLARESHVSLGAVQRTIQHGEKFFDPKNQSIVSVLDQGLASGKSILVGQNPETGLITTVISGRKLVRSRFVPIPD